MGKFYAVKKGRKTGIFTTWAECQKQVSGFPKAEFKSFISKQEADDWLKEIKSSNENRRKSYSVIVYTDGGSRNHGNKKGEHVKKNDKAAWAYLIKYQGSIISDTDGEYGSTNNRMEIMALKKALLDLKQRELQNEKILVVLDSKYVLDAITKRWLQSWEKNGWKTSAGTGVKNKELWMEISRLLLEFPNLDYQWTKGHANDEGNNLVDELLNKTMDQMD
ncbi:ribonuclease H family protein [Ligilactobacillus salivarius]|uniref:ribonuclease H family protein n=1 Tax=Ligilactobacillus salivarius TaxID=1624 RepID=UPI0022DED5BC|nr:ribonuclease H family protein [Ligilactobacillus salivarius]